MPEELQDQLPHLWRLLEGLNIFFTSKPAFEAEDIVGTLVKRAGNGELDIYIVSGDKDFMQLVNDHVFLYSPGGARGQTKIYDNVINEYKNIHKPNAPKGIKYLLKPGDMIIYSGCELEHWREPFKGNLCGQVFLHYNHANGPFAKTNLFDKRPLLGIPKTR